MQEYLTIETLRNGLSPRVRALWDELQVRIEEARVREEIKWMIDDMLLKLEEEAKIEREREQEPELDCWEVEDGL